MATLSSLGGSDEPPCDFYSPTDAVNLPPTCMATCWGSGHDISGAVVPENNLAMVDAS